MIVSVTVEPDTPKAKIVELLYKKTISKIEATSYSEGMTLQGKLVASIEVNLRD